MAAATAQQQWKSGMRTIEQMFHAMLQELYHAEQQLTRALPRMAKEAQSDDLRQAFKDHAVETERHVERLETAFAMIDQAPRAKTCEAMRSIVEEARETIEAVADQQVLDAGLVAAAQAAEHYEIARYGTLCAWAKLMGKPQLARLLHETLVEEKKADERLTMIADRSVNERALSA
jgi:ferritin-like metal-binding protein YciE